MKIKICKKCLQSKSLGGFYKNKHMRDGHFNECKQCCLARAKQHRSENKEYHKERKEKYYHSPAGVYHKKRGQAIHMRIDFSINRDDFIQWFTSQPLVCYYCGGVLINKKIYPNGLVIERRDNNAGYSIDNIVLACQRCNGIKSNIFTDSEMLEIANNYIKPKLRKGK